MAETKKTAAPFEATLSPDGIILHDEGDRRYKALVNHKKLGKDFKAGKPLKLPTTNGSELQIVDESGKSVMTTPVNSLTIELHMGFLHIVKAEHNGSLVKLPDPPKPKIKAPQTPEKPHAPTPPAESSSAAAKRAEDLVGSSVNPAGQIGAAASSPAKDKKDELKIDHMLELEFRALISDQAKVQREAGLEKGWAIVLKTMIDRRIQQSTAASQEPLAAMLLKGIVEKGHGDPMAHQAVCQFMIRVAKGDETLSDHLSEEAKKFAKGLNNPHAIQMQVEEPAKAVTGMNLFAKALGKLSSKAFGARMSGIEYITQQIPFEAGKAPPDPRDHPAHVQRMQEIINQVENHETYKSMVDKKLQAKFQENLDRAKGTLERFGKHNPT